MCRAELEKRRGRDGRDDGRRMMSWKQSSNEHEHWQKIRHMGGA
jgi:hypothetical protein